MVLFLQVFLAFALGLAVSFAFRVMFCAYTPNNVAGTTEAGHVGEEKKRKVRCKEPPSFSGEQDMFSEWLFSMEESIKALKPDDVVAFVGSYLDGNAKKWFIMNLCTDGKRPASWNLFKEQLISAFKSEHDDERNRLLLVQLRQSGDLETYITDFLTRCLLAKDVDELTKSALFVTGLSDSQVKRDVRRAHPKTLQDAIRAARTSYEDLQVDTPVPSSNAASGRLRQLKRRDTRLSAEERQRLMREGRCFRCRELGHRAVNCPLVKGPTPISPVFNLVEAKKNPPPAEDPNENRQ